MPLQGDVSAAQGFAPYRLQRYMCVDDSDPNAIVLEVMQPIPVPFRTCEQLPPGFKFYTKF